MKLLKGRTRSFGISVLAAGLVLATAFTVAATLHGTTASAAPQAQLGPQVLSQQSFEATGLPAGPATGTAARALLPPGLDFKHVHGGPEYVYVVSGSFTVTIGESSTTYSAGDFAFVTGGVPHTASTNEGAEVFILNIRPTGAEWIIPLQ